MGGLCSAAVAVRDGQLGAKANNRRCEADIVRIWRAGEIAPIGGIAVGVIRVEQATSAFKQSGPQRHLPQIYTPFFQIWESGMLTVT